jgi:hypothetical protein
MRHEMFQEMLVFIGLMTTLGCMTKIILTAIQRFRRPEVSGSQDLTALAEQFQRLQLTADSTAIEIERIGEAQRFLTRTLAAPGTPPHREVSGRTTTPH